MTNKTIRALYKLVLWHINRYQDNAANNEKTCAILGKVAREWKTLKNDVILNCTSHKSICGKCNSNHMPTTSSTFLHSISISRNQNGLKIRSCRIFNDYVQSQKHNVKTKRKKKSLQGPKLMFPHFMVFCRYKHMDREGSSQELHV